MISLGGKRGSKRPPEELAPPRPAPDHDPAPPPAPPQRGFWRFETLKARNEEQVAKGLPPIISDFEPDNPNRRERASYNLRVGPEIYISPAGPDGVATRQTLEKREGRIIPPGQFALLQSLEVVTVPEDAIAFITLRSKAAKFRGLVNVSGFYVEPGYSVTLLFAVFNAGPASIHVSEGVEWFEIFFADLDGETEQKRSKPGYQGIPNELITPLTDQFHSLPGLDKKIDDTKDDLDERLRKVEQEHSILRWSLALIVGALITLGVRGCNEAAVPAQGNAVQENVL